MEAEVFAVFCFETSAKGRDISHLRGELLRDKGSQVEGMIRGSLCRCLEADGGAMMIST